MFRIKKNKEAVVSFHVSGLLGFELIHLVKLVQTAVFSDGLEKTTEED